jgi:hypothetical protein
MERRRLAGVLAGVLVAGGAVVALRIAAGPPHVPEHPTPPTPTVVKPFAAPGVLPPTPGHRPGRPTGLTVTPGPHRLLVSWRAGAGAVGYDVRWGRSDLLVAQPYAELAGLSPDRVATVQVRSVDSFGQRSAPETGTGRPLRYPAAGPDDALVDRFTGRTVPNPRLWQLATSENCAQAGSDGHRLVVLSQCGQTSTTLRARTPFRLASGGAELGRFTVNTDAPGENGELDLDLVPGPVTMIDGSPNDSPAATAPGTAAVDGNLPPGTIRLRVAATAGSPETVQVVTGPDTPRVPVHAVATRPVPAPRSGVSVRWDLVLRTDGVQVLRDGVLVATGNVVPQWTQATALVEFGGSSLDQQRFDVTMIGFGGAATEAPALVPGPMLTLSGFPVVAPGSAAKADQGTATGPGSALLRATIVVSPNGPTARLDVHGRPPAFALQVGDTRYRASPAVPGTPLVAGIRYGLVTRLPASALAGHASLRVGLVVDAPVSFPAGFTLLSADLDVTPSGSRQARGTPVMAPSVTPRPRLADLAVQVLDASGNPPGPGNRLPRGRALLDVTMNGVTTEQAAGQVAGLAGFEISLDGTKIVAVPTAVNGPGVDGEWRIAFSTRGLRPGPHSVDVRAYGSPPGTPFAEAFANFQLGR